MKEKKLKIPVSAPLLGEKELEYVINAVKSNWISSKRKYVTEFFFKFSKYCGAKYGIATSSGTTALHLALASLYMGKNGEVIIPTFTMIATANAVTYTGAKPILVDSEPRPWNMDVEKVSEKITKKTKAIIVVHTYGHPVDMDPIRDIADDHGLDVIEDAAEGARILAYGYWRLAPLLANGAFYSFLTVVSLYLIQILFLKLRDKNHENSSNINSYLRALGQANKID